ncbi:hypothetical protein Celaphus_00010175, partial [Cervus elaphus hippelaphus]
MKVLFLTLFLAVVCAAQDEEAEQSLSEVPGTLSGQWRTVYIGSTNPKKIQENGPFRTYFRKLVFDDEKGTVDFYFYVNTCRRRHLNEGQNEFKVISVSKTHLVAHNVNVDDDGNRTELTGLFVKLNFEEEGLEKFRQLTEQKGIEEKNVVNFIEN